MIAPLTILLVASFSLEAKAATGKTANGCTYQVINGEYRYLCEAKPAPSTSTPIIETIQVSSPSDQSRRVIGETSIDPEIEASAPTAPLADGLYASGSLGSSTISETRDNSTGLQLSIGADLEDFWGLELQYSYTKQKLNLGLAGRPEQNPQIATSRRSSTDSEISNQVLGALFQYHLTSREHRFRPYGALGLGWRWSLLGEESSRINYSNLSQQTVGALVGLGVKIRFNQGVSLIGRFDYFLPISRQEAQLDGSNGRLYPTDAKLTGSSQYSLGAGLVFFF